MTLFLRSSISLPPKLQICTFDLIAGIESRGFLFSTLLANKLGIGSFMIRKPGKLPGDLIEKKYSLEYGDSVLSIQKIRILLIRTLSS